MVVDVTAQHFSFNSGVLAVRFDVNAEIFVVLRVSESVVLFESIDLRFADGRNLAFIRVQRSQAFRRRCLATN